MALYHLQKVRFGYTDQLILDITEYSLNRGGITALIGPNGAGKSTLLKLLALLFVPQFGKVYFSDNEVNSNNRLLLSRRIGLVLQSPYLISGSVADNLLLGLVFRRLPKLERAQRLEEVTALLDIGKLIHRSAKTLSSGEIQKIAIGRVLALRPDVLLLDEPFTHLDMGASDELEKLLRVLVKDRHMTVILTSHDKRHVATLTNYVCSLAAGKLVSIDVENLFSK